MIVWLQGTVLKLKSDRIWLKVGDLGYEVICPLNVIAEIAADSSPQKKWNLFVYQHIREDEMSLYGFSSLEGRELFLNLLKVSGIGPKTAVQILSGAPVSDILKWIEEANVKALSRLPKLGKKTAEQMILTLKGKLVVSESEVSQNKFPQSGNIMAIRSALSNLGFGLDQVDKVLKDLPSELGVEEGLRLCLQKLSRF